MSLQTSPSGANSETARARWLLLTASLLSLALWYIPGAAVITYPLRIFVTILHEGGHALMTVLTGGHVLSITIDPSGSGLTLSETRPFALGLVYMAGYLGATLFGAGFLLLGRRKQGGRRGLMLLAALTLLVTLLWIHPWSSPFGFIMGLLAGGALFAGARLLREMTATFLLGFLAVQLCLNALFDLRNLLWLTTNTHAPNDAVFMAQAYGLAPWFWAGLWAVGALVILGVSLRAYWRGSR